MNETEEDLWHQFLRAPPKVLFHHLFHCAVKSTPQQFRVRWLFFITRKREDHLGGDRYRREVFVIDDDRLPGPIFPFHPLACNQGGVVVM